MESAFILGAGGTIGSALWETLLASGIPLEGTTRAGDPAKGLQRFDLASGSVLPSKPGAGVAYLCAADTEMSKCEADPVGTRMVNVFGVVKAARQLHDSGKFVVFLSSSAVFDGNESAPNEQSTPKPSSEYGRQKADAESQLMKIGGVAIVRLTKVFGVNEKRIVAWREELLAGHSIEPYKDLVMAPISLNYSLRLLESIGENQASGIWHGSGDSDISYAEFTMLLADALGVRRELIRPVTSGSKGAHLRYVPKYATMGMRTTSAAFGLQAQPIGHVVSQFIPSGTMNRPEITMGFRHGPR